MKEASPPRICSICGVGLERTADDCPKCGAGVAEPAVGAPHIEKRSFKPYANIGSPRDKELYETLCRALPETDPVERPWCGIGLEVGLLAVSPTNITVAAIGEVNGVQQAVVHVPQNWREPWYVETAEGARHQTPDNPCAQAERAISTIKHSLDSFLRNGDPLTFPCIKYLILFPDGYTFAGPTEFSILERNDVLTLRLKNFRELAEAIVEPSPQQRLDSRKYRAWIESSVLRKSDESIVGTWLDPAFDKVETEPAKRQRWWLRHQEVAVEKEEVLSSDHLQTMPIQQKFKWRQSKLTLTVITGIIIVMMWLWLNEATKPPTSVSHSSAPLSHPRPQNSINAAEVLQPGIPQDRLSAPEHQKPEIVPATEVGRSSEKQKPEVKEKNRMSESAGKPRDSAQGAEDFELEGRKIELQIHQAIRRRAISGVTVHFAGETAHLNGRVDTESQKFAAEKAARSVPGVREVHSSIDVNF